MYAGRIRTEFGMSPDRGGLEVCLGVLGNSNALTAAVLQETGSYITL